jgi:hypothetical protein
MCPILPAGRSHRHPETDPLSDPSPVNRQKRITATSANRYRPVMPPPPRVNLAGLQILYVVDTQGYASML